MSYDRPTVKDVRRIFEQYEELVKEYGLIRPIGYNYLGMTAREAHEAIADRERMVYDIVRALKLEKTNPILDCGHFPTPTASGSGGTGKTYDRDGASMCYACADDQTKKEIANPDTDRITLYVSSSAPDMAYQTILTNWTVATWNGTKMGRVIESSSECVNYTPTGGRYSFYSITVKMDDGSLWYGRASGPGMYVNLKRKKVSK